MARSAAQKRATKKLVALNKRRKSTRKGQVRKTARRAYEPKRSSSLKRKSPRKTMAKRRSFRRRATGGFGNILKSGIVGKAVMGLGAAALVGTVMNRLLPASPITTLAQPIAAYAAGGAVGAVSSVILNGGLGSITGFLGGQQTPSVGTTEFGV
jgi:hypothetical protein|tara:strand:- start:1240 stop:1701 length:462 start_codon:yes stop_codon:yes gene_type:complete